MENEDTFCATVCIPFELRSSNLHHIHDVQECIHSTQIKDLPL